MNAPSLARRLASLLPLSFLLGAVHCSGATLAEPTGDSGAPDSGTPHPPPPGVPTNHRPSPPTCPTARPPGINSDAGVPDAGLPTGNCSRDADCTQGTNGRCLPPQHNAAGDYCTYDACATDSDCGSGKLCECGTGDGTYGRTGNACLPGNCRVDSDCAGGGGFCSPTYDTSCGAYSGTVGYYCHTASDTCTNDSDCTEGGAGYCAWQPAVGKWACSYGFCAG
jgi:hypothetical protein